MHNLTDEKGDIFSFAYICINNKVIMHILCVWHVPICTAMSRLSNWCSLFYWFNFFLQNMTWRPRWTNACILLPCLCHALPHIHVPAQLLRAQQRDLTVQVILGVSSFLVAAFVLFLVPPWKDCQGSLNGELHLQAIPSNNLQLISADKCLLYVWPLNF